VSLEAFLARLHTALQTAGVPYMLTGSFASSFHGTPRTTQDVDIVICPRREQLETLLSHFPEANYYISEEAARDALAREGQFNVIDLATGWKADFIIRKSRSFSIAEFDRRRRVDVSGMTMDIATPEDVLIAKLEWSRDTASQRHLEDAAGILRMQGRNLDTAHIEQWIAALGLADQWAEAKRLAAFNM
jgi:hypothetical protein